MISKTMFRMTPTLVTLITLTGFFVAMSLL